MRYAVLAPPERVHLIGERERLTLCGRALTEMTRPLHEVALMNKQSVRWCAACYELGSPREVAEVSTRFGIPIPPVEVTG